MRAHKAELAFPAAATAGCGVGDVVVAHARIPASSTAIAAYVVVPHRCCYAGTLTLRAREALVATPAAVLTGRSVGNVAGVCALVLADVAVVTLSFTPHTDADV